MKQQLNKGKYSAVLTDDGTWFHANGSDFLFTFIKNDWPDSLKESAREAFEDALTIPSAIKTAVKKTSGDTVVNGLYLLDHQAMTKAMNSIDGMGQTAVNQKSESGSGTAVTINQQFFNAILGGLGGDVSPMLDYLTKEMGDVQAETKRSTVTQNFGTVIGLISVVEVLNVVVTSFQYVFSSQETSSWFVKVNCGSAEHYSYNYSFTNVTYNYANPKIERRFSSGKNIELHYPNGVRAVLPI